MSFRTQQCGNSQGTNAARLRLCTCLGHRRDPEHRITNATQVQRQPGGGTYAAEQRIGYKALRKAGMTPGEARAAIRQAEAYFASLGVNLATGTRIPGNRRERR